jgi:glutamine synthetase
VRRGFNPSEVLDTVEKQNVKFVDLQFTDVLGRLSER